MHTFLQDVRYALRQLRTSPGFAVTAILTLTLGIAANVTVFGVLNALVLRPLDVPHPEQVFFIQPGGSSTNYAYPQYTDIRDRNSTFSAIAGTRIARIGMEAPDGTHPVWGYEATGNYFEMLGLKPALGRFFSKAEDASSGASSYAVLSYSCWKDRFGGDPSIAGRVVRLNKLPYVVLGVAPKGFQGTERFFWPEIWVPMMNEQQLEGYDWIHSRANSNMWVTGRLKPGVSAPQATANLTGIAAQMKKENPATDEHIRFELARPGFLGGTLGGPVEAFTAGVMLLAALVLLAACANLGGLFAARTSDRARELAIRIAIGSSRARMLRQLITESVVVSLAGGLLAIFVGRVLLHLLSVWHPPIDFPMQLVVEPDARVYVFGLLAALLTGIIFGSVPAGQVWKTDPNSAIRNSVSASVGGRRWAFRDLLLGAQIAICCLLITACFVSLRGLQRTFQTSLGFNPGGVTLATFDLHLANYSDEQLPGAQQRLLEAVQHLPGVTAATIANTVPLALDESNSVVYSEGTTDFRFSNAKTTATYYETYPGYFSTVSTRLLAGRDFTTHDGKDAPQVVIINQTLARKLFGTENVVGRHCIVRGRRPSEIVGVVEDGKYTTLTEDPSSAFFTPLLHDQDSSTTLIVRSSLPPEQMVAAVRQAIQQVDSSIPIFSLNSWTGALGIVLFPAQAASIALGVFGALAIMLAVTGIFGLASYTVSKRLKELGLRVALGAQQFDVLHAALSRAALLLGAGSLLGLGLGIAATRVLASIVYRATANDPVVLIAVAFTMALVGIVSASIPARRALAIHPMELLREQ
jgi:predicted permease